MATPSFTSTKRDPLGELIMEAFNNVIQRELAEEDAVRDEIKQRGTYWAASEIWKLRRQVASLRRAAKERDEQ
ncbi:Mg2+ and Co2+ transporter CorA [Bradyrhizobium sp. USDA 3262]